MRSNLTGLFAYATVWMTLFALHHASLIESAGQQYKLSRRRARKARASGRVQRQRMRFTTHLRDSATCAAGVFFLHSFFAERDVADEVP